MPNEETDSMEFRVDRGNLYREETFTDLKSCSLKRLTPIKADGSPDKTRKTIFVGHTTLLSPNGAVPIQSVIHARELQQAIKRYPEAMKSAMERLVEEAKKYKAEKESRIIVPGR
jgi:hypothetical protein